MFNSIITMTRFSSLFSGIVDKSVELLNSQNDMLTLEKVFDLVEQVMVNEFDNPQTDDYEYCRKNSRGNASFNEIMVVW